MYEFFKEVKEKKKEKRKLVLYVESDVFSPSSCFIFTWMIFGKHGKYNVIIIKVKILTSQKNFESKTDLEQKKNIFLKKCLELIYLGVFF